MILKCKRCGREWDYRGAIIPTDAYPQYTSCPRCKTSTKVETD